MSTMDGVYGVVFDRRTLIGWLTVMLAEILLGICIFVFPSYLIFGFMIGLLLVFITMRNLFHGYVVFLILLPFWTVTLSQFFGRVDIRPSDLVFLVVFLSFIIKGIISKKLLAQPNPIGPIVVVFLAWITLSFFWNASLIWGALQWGKIAFGAVVFILTYNIIDSRTKLAFVMKLTVAVSIVFALFGIYHFLMVGTKVVGKFAYEETVHWGIRQGGLRAAPFQAHAHKFGAMMNYGIVIAICLFLSSKSKITRILAACSVPVMIIAVVVSFSRVSYVGLSVVLFLFCVTNKIARRGLVFGAVLVLIVVVSYGPLRKTASQRAYEVFHPSEFTKIGRPAVYAAGFKMFLDYPIIGVGVGSFPLISPRYGGRNLVAPHNIVIYILATYGIVGMFFFAGLIGFLIRQGVIVHRKIKKKPEKQMLFGFYVGLVMYMVQMMADSYRMGEIVVWVALGFTVAALNVFSKTDGGERHVV